MDSLRRPASLDPRELGFTPRRPVPWLSPGLLLRTGVRTGLATILGSYLDKRELQKALPARTHAQPAAGEAPPSPGGEAAQPDGDETWLDYVADTGDGFDATYSVAYLLGKPELEVDGEYLPRGRTLVMGGDLVYPAAGTRAYEDRLKGPFTAALPTPPPGETAPTLYAIPANHDWYDGLTAFLRMFVGERVDHIGAWRTEQTRSYFAVRLPHHWWLFGIDEGVGTYLDDPQLVYFEQVARQLGPDDRVILVAPEPAWGKDDPEGYASIDYFVRRVVAPTGARVPVMVAGDQHYYARYSGAGRELVTCGGGGAYLTATHTLPSQLTVPPPGSIARKASPPQEYTRAARYPDEEQSRRFSLGVLRRLPVRNPGFAALVGVLHTMLMLALAGVGAELTVPEERLVTVPVVLSVLAVGGAAFGMAFFPTGGTKSPRRVVAGVVHAVAHLAAGAGGALLWLWLPFAGWHAAAALVAAVVVYAPVAALVGSELVAAYLAVASRFGVNVNEAFAAQGIEDAKSFLRMRIGADGALTIFPVAVDRACRRWRADPDAPRPDAPWVVPADGEELPVRLAEPPVRVW